MDQLVDGSQLSQELLYGMLIRVLTLLSLLLVVLGCDGKAKDDMKDVNDTLAMPAESLFLVSMRFMKIKPPMEAESMRYLKMAADKGDCRSVITYADFLMVGIVGSGDPHQYCGKIRDMSALCKNDDRLPFVLEQCRAKGY